MKRYSAVKTSNTAKSILIEHGAIHTDIGISMCECGETTAIRGYDGDFNYTSFVPVCECCGDDDAFIDEVLIYIP